MTKSYMSNEQSKTLPSKEPREKKGSYQDALSAIRYWQRGECISKGKDWPDSYRNNR